MKSLLHITPHSFVDLFTNSSSSELFVCSTKKSIESIKEVITKLIDMHNALENSTYTLESVIGVIEVAKFCFDWYVIPDPIRNAYNSVTEYNAYERGLGGQSTQRPAEINRVRTIYQQKVYESGAYNKALSSFEKIQISKNNNLMRDILYTEIGSKTIEAKGNLFAQFLAQNNFDTKNIIETLALFSILKEEHALNCKGEFGSRPVFVDQKITDAYDIFETYIQYGMTVKKGDIFVHSASDNTIPYEIMGTMGRYLTARHYHIG